MKKLFISYAHVDKWQVKSLAEILETANFDPWYDHRLKVGQDWKQQLADGIRVCDAFVYALTPEAVNSEWCQWEFKQALDQQKPVVPVLLRSNTELPEALAALQYADFTEGPNTTSVARLIGDIQASLTQPSVRPVTFFAPENPSGIPGRATNQHVFISYSKQNQRYARQLVAALRDNGFNVWIDDEINYGEDWWDVIEQAIEDCGAFIVLMSPDALNSRWVKREILLAEKRQKPLIPLLYAGSEWSRFLEIQYVDVRGDRLPEEDFMATLSRHIPRLRTLGENVTPNLKQAAEVARQQAAKPSIFISYLPEDDPVKPYVETIRQSMLEIFEGGWTVKDNSGVDEAEVLAQRIERSELQITLLGALYGEPTALDERSQTHLEYDIARGLEVPSITVLLPDTLPHQVSAAQLLTLMPSIQKQLAFRQQVEQQGTESLQLKVATVTEFREQFEAYLLDVKRQREEAARAADAQPPGPADHAAPQQAPVETRPRTSFFSDDDHSHARLDERTLFREIYRLTLLDEELLQYLVQQPLARQMIAGGRYENLSLETQMERLGLMRQGMLLYGTFLCFARPEFLRDHLGGLQMVVYDNIKRGATNNTNLQLSQTNLIRQFDAGMDFVEKSAGLQRAGGIGTASRDELEIPLLALREALANAIVHRSYTTELRHDPTRIEVYPDRLEITSFGAFMPGITAKKLSENPEAVRSRRRNPIISRVFQYMAYVELNASGVSRIFSTTETLGLKKPKIDYDGQDETISVLFYRRSREQMVDDELRRLRAAIDSTDRDRVESAIKSAEGALETDTEFADRFSRVADLLKVQQAYLNAERFYRSNDLPAAQQFLLITLPAEADDALVARVNQLREQINTELERRAFVAQSFEEATRVLENGSPADALRLLQELEREITERERRSYQTLLGQSQAARAEELVSLFESKSISGVSKAELKEAIDEISQLGTGSAQKKALERLTALNEKVKAARVVSVLPSIGPDIWKLKRHGQQVVVQLNNVGVRFGNVTAIQGLNLDVYEKEILVLLGPSGSGKTVLLERLNEVFNQTGRVDTGSIAIKVPMKSLSLEQFLRLSHIPGNNLYTVEIDTQRPVETISLQEEIGRIRTRLSPTALFATTNAQFATAVADRIAVLNAGFLHQIGSPKELYYNPRNVFVAGYLGSPPMNFFDAKLQSQQSGQMVVETSSFAVAIPQSKVSAYKDYLGEKVILGIRPHDIHDIQFQPPGIVPALIEAHVDVVEQLGRHVNLYLEEGGKTFIAVVDSHTEARVGQRMSLAVNLDYLYLFDTDTEINLTYQEH